jgi:hypothetical protein
MWRSGPRVAGSTTREAHTDEAGLEESDMSSARTMTDHDQIRRWAEQRHAQPACVKRTGGKGDPGMIRLDFPGFTGKQSLAPISWNQWFDAFDDNGLALLVQDTTARGQRSNFNKLVSRRSPAKRGRAAQRRKPRAAAAPRKTRRAASAARRSPVRKTKRASTSASTRSRRRSAMPAKKRARSTRTRNA